MWTKTQISVSIFFLAAFTLLVAVAASGATSTARIALHSDTQTAAAFAGITQPANASALQPNQNYLVVVHEPLASILSPAEIYVYINSSLAYTLNVSNPSPAKFNLSFDASDLYTLQVNSTKNSTLSSPTWLYVGTSPLANNTFIDFFLQSWLYICILGVLLSMLLLYANVPMWTMPAALCFFASLVLLPTTNATFTGQVQYWATFSTLIAIAITLAISPLFQVS